MSDGVIDETVRAVRKFLKKPDGSTPQSNQIADFLGWSEAKYIFLSPNNKKGDLILLEVIITFGK